MILSEEDEKKYLKYEGLLSSIAEKFRTSDTNFPSFELKRKMMLNIVGKILQSIHFLLMRYRYLSDEQKVNIIETFSKIEKFLDECLEELEESEYYAFTNDTEEVDAE